MDNIRTVATNAVILFGRCQDVIKTNPQVDVEPCSRLSLSEVFGRFRLWAGNLGVFQDGHASLDWRLRESTNLSKSVRGLIGDLNDNLENCLAIICGDRLPLDETDTDLQITDEEDECDAFDDDIAEDEGELMIRLADIRHTVDNLYELSFVIRNHKSKQSNYRKAESYRSSSDDTDSLQCFHRFDRMHIEELINEMRRDGNREVRRDPMPDTTKALIQRLVQASDKRRRQFFYWERHDKKLNAQVPTAEAGLLNEPHANETSQPVIRKSAIPESEAGNTRTMLSGTEATDCRPHGMHQGLDTMSVVSFASTLVDIAGNEARLPDPPRVAEGRIEFECPYCHVICPVKDLVPGRWRKHMLEDLRPYMCTYAECPTANELYDSRRDWLAHEQQVHRQVWRCRDHVQKPFDSESSFKDHLAEEHRNMNAKEIEALNEFAKVALDDSRSHCPICLLDFAQLPKDQSFFKHTANHFETFATFPLPCNVSSTGDHTSESKDDDISVGSNIVIADLKSSGRDVGSDTDDDWYDNMVEDSDQGTLHIAAAKGYTYLLRGLLGHGTDVGVLNSKDQEGWTALQRAAFAGHDEAAQLLIEKGADVNARGSEYGDALQAAAARGHATIVRTLLEHSAAINARGGRHSTALRAAAWNGYVESVRILLDAQPQGDGGTAQYQDAIGDASAQGHVEIVRMLQAAQKRQGPTPSPGIKFSNTTGATQGLNRDESLRVKGGDTGQSPRLEVLDPSFKLRNKGFFIRGRVLLTLWSETGASSATRRTPSSLPSSSNRDVHVVALQEQVISRVRRFVVIAESDRSCTALAISTRSDIGMQQDRSQYGIIYTGSAPPPISESERGMQAIAIRIDPDNAAMPLNPMSRLNYGKIYTIEHNFKVRAYGMVSQASLVPLMSQFQQVNGKRLGFRPAPLQTSREERIPPDVTPGPEKVAQELTDHRQPLLPQYQRTTAQHPSNVAGTLTTTQSSRSSAPDEARAPQSSVPDTGTDPASVDGQPAAPAGSVEDLRQLGFDEAQIRSIRDTIDRGMTAQYAVVRASALAQLGCNPETANNIAQAVQDGVPYARVIAQYRTREAQAAQQQASGDASPRAAYDESLPGSQPQRTTNTQGYQLQQVPSSSQSPPRQSHHDGALSGGGNPQADNQGRGHPLRPSQVQPRTQPGISDMSQLTQSMANTNLAPGASNSAASSVQTRRFQRNSAALQHSLDPNTGVQVILQKGPSTPRNLQAEGITAQRELIDTAGSTERLFPEYIVRSSRFFCLGRVFLVLWAEPAGGNAGTVDTMQEQGTVLNHLGERVYSKVRRFVVIRKSERFCNALPITTYSGRGVAKRGVVKSEHAIIYTGKTPPSPQPDERPSRGETGMRPTPIRVDPDNPTDRLDPMSRVNFGGVHQVQHNIKTKSLGIVSRQSIYALQSQYMDVWNDQLQKAPNDGSGDDDDEEADTEEDSADTGTKDEEEISEVKTRDKGGGSGWSKDDPQGTNLDASTSKRDGIEQLEASASKEQLDRIYHDHLRNMEVMQNSSGSTDTPPSIRAETLKSPEPDMQAPAHELVMDRIFNYRLSREIVEEQLLKMFPKLSNAALEVKEEDDVFTFHVPQMLTSEQKRQILAIRLRDRDRDWE